VRLTVSGYRGISERVDVDVNSVTILGGKVGAGKSSIIGALRACALGDPNPTKTKARLVNRMRADGYASWGDAEGEIAVKWPGGVGSAGSEPSGGTPFSVGLQSLVDMGTRERSDFITKLLKAVPTDEEIVADLVGYGVKAEKAKTICDEIDAKGFDAVYEAHVISTRMYKAEWRRITHGENFGTAKSAKWRPAGWSNKLHDATEATLRAAIDGAQVNLEKALKQTGAREAELRSITRLIETSSTVERAAELASRAFDQAVAKANDLGKKLGALRKPPEAEFVYLCPHCRGKFVIQDLVAAPYLGVPITEEERRAYDDLFNQHTQAEYMIKSAHRNLDAAVAEVQKIKEARRRLDAFAMRAPEEVDPNEVSEDDARQALNQAKLSFEAWVSYNTALNMLNMIEDGIAIQRVLAPEGIRAKKTGNALGGFNIALRELCSNASLPLVALTSDFRITYDSEDYEGLSTGEQYLAEAVIRVAVTNLQEAGVLILDIDRPIEDGKSIQAILRLLQAHTDAASVLCITCASFLNLPTVHEPDAAYWVQDGRARSLLRVSK